LKEKKVRWYPDGLNKKIIVQFCKIVYPFIELLYMQPLIFVLCISFI